MNIGGEGLKERFSDESYINKNHARQAGLFITAEGNMCNKPSGKGPRFILTGVGSEDGWDGWKERDYTDEELKLESRVSSVDGEGFDGGVGSVHVWKAAKGTASGL